MYISAFLMKNIRLLFANSNKSRTFALTKHRGVEQLVARWAHNPKVVSSSLASATKKSLPVCDQKAFFFR